MKMVRFLIVLMSFYGVFLYFGQYIYADNSLASGSAVKNTRQKEKSEPKFNKSLKIKNCFMRTCRGSKKILIIGVIENNSNFAWDHIVVNVKFYDKNKNLTDGLCFGRRELAVGPNLECVFRKKIDNSTSLYDYDRFDTSIVYAVKR